MLRYSLAVLALAICATCPAVEAQDSDKLAQTIADAFRGCLAGINPGAVKGGNMAASDLPGIGRPVSNLEAVRIETATGRLFQYRYRRGGVDACGVAFYGAPPIGIVDTVSALIKNTTVFVEQNGAMPQWTPAAQETYFSDSRRSFRGAAMLTREPSNDAPSFQADYSEMLFH
jgi:hypothetical protein